VQIRSPVPRLATPDGILERQLEEKLFDAVAAELASGTRREGLWLKAVADASGSESAARALYVRYRAQSMLDEAALQRLEEERQAKRRRVEELMRMPPGTGRFLLVLGLVFAWVVLFQIICTGRPHP
jgi:hypothetical protein